jgi:hypothetical protein
VAAVALVWLAVCATPAVSVENETFGLTPQPERIDGSDRRTFGIPLEPGSVFEDAVRIYNRTDQPLELAVYAADAEAGLDGTISVGFRGSRPKGLGKWIDLSRREVNLPPRGEMVVPFRIEVRSADPAPDLGAIVVENTARGLSADQASRLHLVVRTSPPNSPTTSVRVRPLLLRSPWIIVAILGLIAALTIIWLGARRARRPKDVVVAPGELRKPTSEDDETPAASRPVLRRLGESQTAEPGARHHHAAEVAAARQSPPSSRTAGATPTRTSRPRPPTPQPDERDDSRPLVDDLLVEVDREPAVTSARAKRPAQRRAKPRPAEDKSNGQKAKQKFIPLDEL